MLSFPGSLYQGVMAARLSAMDLCRRTGYAGPSSAGGEMPERPLVAIVDDDRSIRDATRALLKAEGFSAATFEDAASFLGSASRGSVACLVTDMRMPGMTGLELYESLVAS